jgi:spore germination protein YaaH
LLIASTLLTGFGARAAEYKQNMTYIYFGDYSRYTKMVEDTQNSVNEVAPAYFELDSSGNLILTPSVSSDFINNMHDKGILVVPYISNNWDRSIGRAALYNRETLARDLVKAVSDYDLDGINVDIENVTHTEREAYVDFVRILRELLPQGKILAVAVAANPNGATTGWLGSYDYAGLAQYSDYLMIMAYDEAYYGGTPGPVASLGFVEKSIKYALKYTSKDKLMLGLPFYGRIWAVNGGAPNGYGISNVKATELIGKYRGTVKYYADSGSACATITVKSSDIKPVIGGKTLASGTYVIWFSDERSTKASLELVTKYDLRGTGSWSLGQETDDTWDYYKLWLNGCTFEDIQNSWAKSSILTVFKAGLMNGTGPAAFSPDSPFTRAQAAAVLVRLMGLSAQEEEIYEFSDCSNHWAEAYIQTARKYGLVTGTGSNLFEPDRPVTREEIAVMLSRLLSESCEAKQSSFTDVTQTADSWSYFAIAELSSQGIITGYPDNSFRPSKQLTRAELAVIIARLAPSMLIEVSAG